MNTTRRTLGKYELIERLGQGGMAEVFKAYQPGLERFVAIKVLHAHLATSPDFVERFRREARVVGQLQHAHIVRVIDFDVQDDAHYLVMDYIQGGTLKQYLREQGAMPPAQALPLAAQVADALAYAHQRDMIHRDIKSDNILFLDEQHTHAILTDFGIARLISEVGMTLTGAMIGTPAYMSPEAVRGEQADVRSDIYSLGVVLYEMLTGRTPYLADTPYSMVMKQMNEPLPEPRTINPEVPEALNTLLLKALAKEPDERYQSAAELHAAIRSELSQPTTSHMSPAPAAAPAIGTQTLQAAPSSTTTGQPQPAPAAPPKKPAAPGRSIPRWLYLVGAGLGVCLVAVLMVVGLLGLGGADGDNLAAEDAPPPAAATPADEPGAAPPADQREPAGLIQFLDNEDAPMGTILVQIDDAPPLPDGEQYRLWLTGDENTPPLSAGALPLDAGLIDATHATDQNVLADYREALITRGADGAEPAAPDADSVAFRGALPADVLPAIRQLLVVGDGTEQGLLHGAAEEASLATEHGDMLQDSLDSGDLPEAKRHAEHIVNILDGDEGEHFGDIDRDGRPENPGDGFGVRRYLEEAGSQARQVAEQAAAAEMQQIGAEGVLASSERSLTVVDAAIDAALQFSAVDSIEEGQPVVDDLRALLDALLAGTDENEDGTVNPTAEGMILSAYEFGTLIGSITLFAEE